MADIGKTVVLGVVGEDVGGTMSIGGVVVRSAFKVDMAGWACCADIMAGDTLLG